MGASVINVHIRVVMPANRLRVNHYDFYGTSLDVENSPHGPTSNEVP